MVRTGLAEKAVGMAATVTVNDVLDGHVGLDLECPDRVYLNGYLPEGAGRWAGGAVYGPAGCPVPSPAFLQQIGDAFRGGCLLRRS